MLFSCAGLGAECKARNVQTHARTGAQSMLQNQAGRRERTRFAEARFQKASRMRAFRGQFPREPRLRQPASREMQSVQPLPPASRRGLPLQRRSGNSREPRFLGRPTCSRAIDPPPTRAPAPNAPTARPRPQLRPHEMNSTPVYMRPGAGADAEAGLRSHPGSTRVRGA